MSIMAVKYGRSKNIKSKSSIVTIYIHTTYISFKCSRFCTLENGFDIAPFIKRNLTEYEYNHRYRRYIVTYQYNKYFEEEEMIRIPRYHLDLFIRFIEGNKYELVNVPPVSPSEIYFPLKEGIEPREHQIPIIEFIKSEGNFKPIGVFTGGGKSFMAVAGISIKSTPAIIVLSSLIPQWVKTIMDFTDVERDDIYIVQGFDKLKTLWEYIDAGYKPKIIIFSTRTLIMYCVSPKPPYSYLPSYEELQEKLGIGMKIIDEVHMNFNANVMVDLHSNIENNVYLSATYDRTNENAKRIFNIVFPAELIYGDAIGSKYTTVHIASYHMIIPMDDRHKLRTEKGYNHALYENYLMDNPDLLAEFMELVLHPLMNQYYYNLRNKGQKLLILCATRRMALKFKELVSKSEKSCEVFFSGDYEYGNEDTFVNYDVIISTHKSCGTGRDIKNLKTCINTLSFSSKTLSNQTMGRLRELKGEDTHYVDIFNSTIDTHVRHMDDRIYVYRTKAKHISKIKLN